MYRLVATDIDGTLLDSSSRLRPRVRKALDRARERGVKVIIATGRRLRATLHIAREAGIGGPLVLNNGALVYDPDTGETLDHRPIPVPTARRAIRLIQAYGLGATLYHHVPEGPDIAYEIEGNDPLFREMLDRNQGSIQQVPDLSEFCAQPPDKILAFGPEGKIRAICADLTAHLPDAQNLLALDGTGIWFAEVFSRSASKATGIQAVARRLGIKPSEVIALGDGFNDLEMIEYAGLGVAMGNAVPELKAIADLVTATNDEDGVAQVLEEYVLTVA